MTVAIVKGLQGDDPKYWRTASLLKHFMANSNEDGRGGSSSNFDERLLREYYSVPCGMGIEEGGAQAFMTAYNVVSRIPMTGIQYPLAGEGKEAVGRKSITLDQEEFAQAAWPNEELKGFQRVSFQPGETKRNCR